MSPREFTEEENRILNEALRTDKRDTSKQSSKDEQRIAELAKLSKLKYAQCSKQEAKKLGVSVAVLNKLVAEQRKKSASENGKKKIEAPDLDEFWRSAGHIINHP